MLCVQRALINGFFKINKILFSFRNDPMMSFRAFSLKPPFAICKEITVAADKI